MYPAHLQSLWIVISVAVALHMSGKQVPFNMVNRILAHVPEYVLKHFLNNKSLISILFASVARSPTTVSWQLFACSMSGLLVWLGICYTMRYTLKLLLMYKGWMYESRGSGSKVSLPTKLWAGATKVLSSWNKPNLYSFQGSLPRLPLPSVHDTTQRVILCICDFSPVIVIKFLQYLRSVRPLLDDDAYANMEKLAKEFESTVGGRFQMYLMLKSWWSTNYVSDWWEEYVYLRGRSALMINSNFYGIDAIYMNQTSVQAARAANISYLLLTFRRMVERQELEPVSGYVEHHFFSVSHDARFVA